MPNRETVMVVDDEPTICEVVKRYLELEGFGVIICRDGQEALAAFKPESVDLVMLDIMLPFLDGYALIQHMRRVTLDKPIPIIVLTSLSQENDRVLGFELGADDYVVKPFSPRELIARVKAVLKRSMAKENISPAEEIIVEDLRIDPLRRSVEVADQPISLTLTEFNLLWFFVRHPQQVLTREQIVNQIWGYEYYGAENTLSVHVRRLREKIEPDPSHPKYIHTVRGIGYKFDTT